MPDTAQTTDTQTSADDINTVSFVSLGCPKNLVDSEKMLGLLASGGVAPVSAGAGANREDLSVAGSEQNEVQSGDEAGGMQLPTIDPADAVVVNTCGFLEASKQESMAVIREAVKAKERGEIKRVVVAGCLVQRHRAKMLEWEPGIDAMVGVHDRERIVEAVKGFAPKREGVDDKGVTAPYWINPNAIVAAKNKGMDVTGLTVLGKARPAGKRDNGESGEQAEGIGYYEDDSARLRLTPRHYAYLRISEGCNQSCAFCTIPSIRGKMRSKPADRIVGEARELIRDGAFELLMIGQDTTSYAEDIDAGNVRDGLGLARLLDELSDVVQEEAGKAWLRLMYAYPSTFSDEMIDAFARLVERGYLLPYIDIPLQHASQNMLDQMRRHVSAQQQRELCLKLRERVPGMAIRTTFISGFPGETDADHQELLEFIDEVGFDAVGVFTYSPEPGTVAGKMADDPELAVPHEVALERKAEIMELQQQIAFEQNEFMAEQFDPQRPTDTGVVLDVLIDEYEGEAEAAGAGADPISKLIGGPHVHKARTYFQAPGIDACTYVHSREKLSPGELVKCTVVASDGYDLIARPQSELSNSVRLPVIG